MGAAVSVEGVKPLDGSDLEEETLQAVKDEVTRLRTLLQAHVDEEKKKEWPLDVSDICQGGDEAEEKIGCIREICNVRKAISMAGQQMQRRACE
jgi:hypothetical protein